MQLVSQNPRSVVAEWFAEVRASQCEAKSITNSWPNHETTSTKLKPKKWIYTYWQE
jgi:hypothetical protein